MVRSILPLLPSAAPARLLLTNRAAPIAASSLGSQTRTYVNVPAAQESFLNGGSSVYVEQMYDSWLRDPSSVHAV